MHQLYRFYNSIGELLYVGISNNAYDRMKQHRKGSDWYHHAISITIENYGNREDLELAEKKAIQIENPIYNVIRYSDVDISIKVNTVPTAARENKILGMSHDLQRHEIISNILNTMMVNYMIVGDEICRSYDCLKFKVPLFSLEGKKHLFGTRTSAATLEKAIWEGVAFKFWNDPSKNEQRLLQMVLKFYGTVKLKELYELYQKNGFTLSPKYKDYSDIIEYRIDQERKQK